MSAETSAPDGVDDRLPVAVRDEGDRVVERPTVAELHGLLARIGPSGDGFLVLSGIPEDAEVYAQTLRFDDGVYLVEYRDGSKKRHFQTDDALNTDQVLAVLVGWARGEEGWQGPHKWRRLRRWMR